MKRMAGSFILGADFLREHGATILYFTLNTAHFSLVSKTDMVTDLDTSTEEMDSKDPLDLSGSVLEDGVADNDGKDQILGFTTEEPTGGVEKRLSVDQNARLAHLLNEYANLLDGSLGLIHGYTHVIEMKDQNPGKPRSFPVPLKYREEVREQLQEMEKLGVISKKATEFVNPLVIAMRSNGKIRICLDARSINEKIANEHAQPPSIDEVLAVVGERKFFSKIDINKAYWQIKLDENSTKYTGFLFDGQTCL